MGTVNNRFASPKSKEPWIFAKSAVAVSHTGNTNETTLRTLTLPGGLLGKNDSVEVVTRWSYTNSANNKTVRVRFGGTSMYGVNATTTAAAPHTCTISNRNATNSQIANPGTTTGGWGVTSNAMVTSAIDTTADVPLLIQGTLASAAETITLEEYIVTIIPGE